MINIFNLLELSRKVKFNNEKNCINTLMNSHICFTKSSVSHLNKVTSQKTSRSQQNSRKIKRKLMEKTININLVFF